MDNPSPKKRQTRCKNGERRNPKTGLCEPHNKTRKIKMVETLAPIETTISPTYLPLELVQNPTQTSIELEESLKEIVPITQDEREAFFKEQEKKEWTESLEDDGEYDFLYPSLNDANFSAKIAKRKEFADTKYDGAIKGVKTEAERLCNLEFELNPYQLFVRNFLSLQTPYNSLLLYHGLGSGKTCSAIGIAEEMRAYLKDIGLQQQKIFIIASPNMQENFRLQLFNENKLILKDGLWKLNTCVGNQLLREMNPTNLKDIPKERVISQLNAIIKKSYVFMGYIEFANYIHLKTAVSENSGFSESAQEEMRIKNIQRFFEGRLIIIDEIHNIRVSEDNKKGKRIARLLMDLAKWTDHLRLLLLSATPMYNSYKEIIWLTNLMNINDKRSTISVSDVFEKDGTFKEGGKELLQRKLTGYVSYIRSENPYTFPFRIYPTVFDRNPETGESLGHHFFDTKFNSLLPYPTHQLNTNPIETPLRYIHVYVNRIGEIQEQGYIEILENIRKKSRVSYTGSLDALPNEENMESYGYTMLQPTLEALNIVYPNPKWKMGMEIDSISPEEENEYPITGSAGLSSILRFQKASSSQTSLKYNCEYKEEILKEHGRIFHPSKIGTYSSKIASICENIRNSKGIVLIFSQYIDGGVIPMALALEEMGFTRFGTSAAQTRSLFKHPPTKNPLNAATMQPHNGDRNSIFYPAQYILITGDKTISPNNADDIAYLTHPNNKDGHFAKVVIISKAGAEGLDFKYIRQVHIMEPWYNMNRIEQIIGRGVRNQSHCALPFEERNVQIFLHATALSNRNNTNKEESADMYLYRFAEKKALQIGQVTRVLKETAVDCLLNISQTNFTVDKLASIAENQRIRIRLSNGLEVDFSVGDNPRTDICDYMDNCAYQCAGRDTSEITEANLQKTTYHTGFLSTNYDQILKKIQYLFHENVFYTRQQIESEINQVKIYPLEQIYYVLTQLLESETILTDKYGRSGKLINRGNIYTFQPLEISDETAPVYDRSVPIEYKREALSLKIADKFSVDIEPSDEIVQNIAVEEDIYIKSYYGLLKKIQENRNITKEPRRIPAGETDWYMHISRAIEYLEMIGEISLEDINKYILYHQLDTLVFKDKLLLLKRMSSFDSGVAFPAPPADTEIADLVPIELGVRSYFEERRLIHRNTLGIEKVGYVLANTVEPTTAVEIYVENGEGEWKSLDEHEWNQFEESLRRFFFNKQNYSPIIGFMYPFKSKEIVFKTKDLTIKRRNNTGARCDSAGKSNIIKLLGKIGEKYTVTLDDKIKHEGICGIVEILLRHFTYIKENNKIWFLSMETAIWNKVETV
jgi:superfamily II DNA or RNA helicase